MQIALVDVVTRGAYQLEPFTAGDVGEARRIKERYFELRIGLPHASVVVPANGHHTLDLLCTDERHFRALRGAGGRRFRLWPADAT